MKHATLYVIAVISNPIRFQSRYRLYKQFEKHIKDTPNTHLVTVELAFGDRPFEVTEKGNPNHLQLRSFHELWFKETMINLGIQHLNTIDNNWEYVAWVDADIQFTRPDWALETLHQLQHYFIVQMWRNCIDMGPNYEIVQTHQSFMHMYHQNNFHPPIADGRGCYYGIDRKAFWHPGYAWAARREAIDHVGGLIDAGKGAVLGSGDHHMALGLIGQIYRSIPHNVQENYKKYMRIWQERAERYIMRDVGFVDTIITHFFHGKKKDRRYQERWDIIIKNKFDPELDLKRDSYGLYQLTDRNWRLRDEIRAYFRQRNEDSIDL